MFTKDKLYHLVAGFIIGIGFGFWNPVVALFAAGAAGVGKEVYDKYIKKSFADPVDTISTFAGAMVGTAFAIFLINLF